MRELGIDADIYRHLRRSQRYSIEHVFHALVKEPFNVAYEDLKGLTPVVVKHVYFRQDGDDPNGVTGDLKEFDRRMRESENKTPRPPDQEPPQGS